MGFLKRLFGKVEKVNKGEATIEELNQSFTLSLEEEADNYWFQMEQNILVNAVKAAAEAAVLTLASSALALVSSSALTSAMAVRWLSALDPWEYASLIFSSCSSLFPALASICAADLSVARFAMPAAIVAVAFSLPETR